MPKDTIGQYRLTEEKEMSLWKEAIMVFDSSALLDLYFLPKAAREKTAVEIFDKLVDRLWLPFHVHYEYSKNRGKVIKKPISEKYEPLKKKIKDIRLSSDSLVFKKLEAIIEETSNGDKHPHIEQKRLEDFKEEVKAFLSKTQKFEVDIMQEIERAEIETSSVESNDDVLELIDKYFEVGRDFTFDEILQISKEGKHRFEFKIPPGYGDFYANEKKGMQIFGDLIIWKQILEYSKKNKKPIVFITNDTKKDEDWCYISKKEKGRIEAPREELIKEIKDLSNVDFWMYNLPQFLRLANKYLKSTIKKELIEDFSHEIDIRKSHGTHLRFQCNGCRKEHKYEQSDLHLDFELWGGTERSMGMENHYQAQEQFNCSCGNIIEAYFNVWEYPEGIHNYDRPNLVNATLKESFYFTMDFHDEESDIIQCHECDGNKDGVGNYVAFTTELDLNNDYDSSSPYHKFNSVLAGNCQHCNELHIRCVKCNSSLVLSQFKENEDVECEGGCGLIYQRDSSYDFDNIGDFDIRLIDHRVVNCASCGNAFISKDNAEICQSCEDKYNDA